MGDHSSNVSSAEKTSGSKSSGVIDTTGESAEKLAIAAIARACNACSRGLAISSHDYPSRELCSRSQSFYKNRIRLD